MRVGPLPLFLLALALPALAQPEPAGTYPAGIREVGHGDALPASDFSMYAAFDANVTPTRVNMVLCHFDHMADASPDLCYAPLSATPAGGRYVATTSSAQHPSWSTGTVLGYKVLAETGGGELHAPANGDYYRLTVAYPATDGGGSGGPSPPPEPAAAAPVALALAVLGVLAAIRRR
jgi:hypothetical protein